MANKPTPTSQPQSSYELSDLSPTSIIIFGLGIAILIAGSIFAVVGLLNVFETRSLESQAVGPALLDTEQLPPTGPRLQANPERDLQDLQAADQAILTTYGWVDQETGKVRIPIDQAMDLLLKQGLPVRDEIPEKSE